VALSTVPILAAELLPEPLREEMASYGKPPSARDSSERDPTRQGTPSEEELRALLAEHRGNVAAVSRILGKARMQIHRWVERYVIDLDDYRDKSEDTKEPP
jgi:transcriptional regulator of acetoin/glycerol metabolism